MPETVYLTVNGKRVGRVADFHLEIEPSRTGLGRADMTDRTSELEVYLEGSGELPEAADGAGADSATRDALQQTNDELDALRARVATLEERLDSV